VLHPFNLIFLYYPPAVNSRTLKMGLAHFRPDFFAKAGVWGGWRSWWAGATRVWNSATSKQIAIWHLILVDWQPPNC